ncbi:MAG: tetratricopeptide repeat protein, partial [Leptolyngbya sp. RL_3_1]|nr:tetratricopeptide repeat protein [Leptolyngbya sp. RL_3_1]
MPHAHLLNFALLSALLVPATQFASGWQPLQAARSGEAPQIPGFFGEDETLRPNVTPEPWDLDPLKEKDPKAALSLPEGLEKVAPLVSPPGLKQAGTDTLLEVEGQLEDGDQVLQDGSLYDLHTFEGEAGQFIEIRLSSDDFDTYLTLVGPDDERVAENDDSVEGLNSIIHVQLNQTGQYSVLANTYNASGRGGYRLTVATISAEDYQRAQEINTATAEADQLLEQGLQQYSLSQFREALAAWERALELYQAAGNRLGEGRALNNFGIVYYSLGQYERAIDSYQQSLEIAREIGNLAGEGRA